MPIVRSNQQLQTKKNKSDQQTCLCKSIAQTRIPIPIPNMFPVGSVDRERPYALSSGQAHFHLTRTKQPFLESAETFHDGPEQLYRARALHVESEGPDGQISPPVVSRVGKRRASGQSGRLHGVCTRFDAKTSFDCKISPSAHICKCKWMEA
jgi:hypothetical protein